MEGLNQDIELGRAQVKQQENDNRGLVDIAFQNIEYKVYIKNKKEAIERTILKNVSGICKGGECTAILGSSGAGKTSLLNILAKRVVETKENKLEGRIFSNNIEYTYQKFAQFSTYVMQDDRLSECMTVKETLQFAADLRIKGSQEERENIVKKVIKMLNLERAQNTFIGGKFLKGISGGERKRTSIGFELACQPQVILLDEPTSGLDSFTAFLLILVLQRYSRRGKTVIFTIHQPSADIWGLFDRIMLLQQGNLIYQGKGGEEILQYFSKQGVQCPKNRNPADFFMEMMSYSGARGFPLAEQLADYYQNNLAHVIEEQIKVKRTSEIQILQVQKTLWEEVRIIGARTVLTLKRNPIVFKARVIQTIILTLIVGSIYWKLSNGYNNDIIDWVAIQNKNGFLFFTAVNQFMLSMNPTVLTFPSERAVFLKESNMNMYSLPGYFIGKTLPELPIMAMMPLLYCLIIYWMAELDDSSAAIFFEFYLISLMQSLNGNSLGLLAGSAFKDEKTAIGAVPVFILPFMLFGGFYNNRQTFFSWIGWLEYLSPFKYGFEGFAWNQYQRTGFRPDPISTLGLELGYWNVVWIMIGCFAGYRILAYFFLWKNKTRLQ